MDKEQNNFQKFFRNELTWFGMVILAFWGVITSIVLPLQKLQIQMAQIQNQLKSVDALNTEIQNISTKQQVDEEELSQITQSK